MSLFGIVFTLENTTNVIVYTEIPFTRDIIVGSLASLPTINSSYFYDENNSELISHIDLENKEKIYVKYSLGERTILDFKHSLFWFGIKHYKEIQELLQEPITDEELVFFYQKMISFFIK